MLQYYINILSKLLDFFRRSAVKFGLKKTVKNTGIPVFTGILMVVYRYSVFAISIHSIYNKLEAILFEEMRRIGLLREIVKYTASLL